MYTLQRAHYKANLSVNKNTAHSSIPNHELTQNWLISICRYRVFSKYQKPRVAFQVY